MSTTFAAVIARARRIANMTAAEFDYDLQDLYGTDAALAYGMAVDVIARETGVSRDSLNAEHMDAFRAMIEDAKGKRYTGWSNASRGPIRYA